MSPRQYYDELLEMEYFDEDGEFNINPKHLSNMLDLVKTEEDMDTVIEAYYNFKGHKTDFSNRIVDKLIVTAVRLEKPEKIFDILNYHNYLLYYPHTKTVNIVLNQLITSNDIGMLNTFLGIIKTRKLIRVDQSFVNTLERTADAWKREGLSVKQISGVLDEFKARVN